MRYARFACVLVAAGLLAPCTLQPHANSAQIALQDADAAPIERAEPVDEHVKAIRQFARNMYTGRPQDVSNCTIATPDENASVLYARKIETLADRVKIEHVIDSTSLVRLSVGETVPIPDGSPLTLTAEHVSESQQVYRFADGAGDPAGEVFTVVKVSGKWLVDPAWQIEARSRKKTSARRPGGHVKAAMDNP